MARAQTTQGKADDPNALREEWLRRLSDLAKSVKGWAEELDWSTCQIEKKMKDSRSGLYEAGIAHAEGDDPRAPGSGRRFAPGAEGVVDLYSCRHTTTLPVSIHVDGEWRLHYSFPNTAAVRDNQGGQVLSSLPKDAGSRPRPDERPCHIGALTGTSGSEPSNESMR